MSDHRKWAVWFSLCVVKSHLMIPWWGKIKIWGCHPLTSKILSRSHREYCTLTDEWTLCGFHVNVLHWKSSEENDLYDWQLMGPWCFHFTIFRSEFVAWFQKKDEKRERNHLKKSMRPSISPERTIPRATWKNCHFLRKHIVQLFVNYYVHDHI